MERRPFSVRQRLGIEGVPSRRDEPCGYSVSPLGPQRLAGSAGCLIGGDSEDLDSPAEFCDDIGQLFILVHRSSFRDHGPVAAAALGDSHEIKISK